ncbi:MAG TPA: FkbM family methyltransferase [Candidatus Eisenbacteria bacterium]|nr:FkbM family methyltransferase [Candidatus Eisenbacteria bacterium]
MKAENLVRLARITRPVMRYRTPVLHRALRLALKALCPPRKNGGAQLVVPFDGGLVNVDLSSSIEYDLLFRGCHEPEIANLIKHTVRPGDICLDIGANVGAHALTMAKFAGPAGRVIAVEPHPYMCARLRQNVALNHLTNVTVVEAALFDKNGPINLYGFDEAEFHRGGSSLVPGDGARVPIQVRAIRGSTLRVECRIDSCSLLKIDVEGAEGIVLSELADLISSHRPVIICEYKRQHWEKFGQQIGSIVERLKAWDYELYYVEKNVTQPLRGAPPDACELFCVPNTSGR